MHRTLCIGLTSDLQARVYEHKNALVPGFTSDVGAALSREKQLKGWLRAKKLP
jgi:putative endonuclease